MITRKLGDLAVADTIDAAVAGPDAGELLIVGDERCDR
jgi:hypothetical protein